MRTSRLIAALAGIAGLAAVAAPSLAQKLKPEQEAAIQPAGKPVSCIPLNQIRESRVRDDSTIDFYMNGRQVYRNKLPYECSGLGVERAFSYKTSLSQLCSTDIITVFRQGEPRFPGASCGLGEFQPITGAPR